MFFFFKIHIWIWFQNTRQTLELVELDKPKVLYSLGALFDYRDKKTDSEPCEKPGMELKIVFIVRNYK